MLKVSLFPVLFLLIFQGSTSYKSVQQKKPLVIEISDVLKNQGPVYVEIYSNKDKWLKNQM
jgi:uncharacterized protein (DUF2141 family)